MSQQAVFELPLFCNDIWSWFSLGSNMINADSRLLKKCTTIAAMAWKPAKHVCNPCFHDSSSQQTSDDMQSSLVEVTLYVSYIIVRILLLYTDLQARLLVIRLHSNPDPFLQEKTTVESRRFRLGRRK